MPTFPSSWRSTQHLLEMVYTGRSSSLPGAWLHVDTQQAKECAREPRAGSAYNHPPTGCRNSQHTQGESHSREIPNWPKSKIQKQKNFIRVQLHLFVHEICYWEIHCRTEDFFFPGILPSSALTADPLFCCFLNFGFYATLSCLLVFIFFLKKI